MKRGNRSGGDPGSGAGRDSKVTLDVQEEVAKILEDASCEAHDEKGRHDHHPAKPPARRSSSPGLHPHRLTPQAALLPASAEWLSCNKTDKLKVVDCNHCLTSKNARI